MRIFLALVWREVFERRLLLLTSAVLGLVPIVLPWLPGFPERFRPEELRTAAILLLTALFGTATLLILGSTIVGRDSSEGRLGFYFSRPISSWVLWSSRVVAAASLLLASLVLLAAPTAVLDLDSWIDEIADRSGKQAIPILASEHYLSRHLLSTLPDLPLWPIRLGLALLALLTLLVSAHAAFTIVRGRSLWVLADLAGLAVFLAIGAAARDLLVHEEAFGALVWAEWLLLPWILASVLAAGAIQLERGRTDHQRAHRWLSVTLWPALIAGALAFAAYARFVAGSRIEDLENLTFTRPSPNDEWLIAGGPVRFRAGSEAAFLLDTRSRRSWRLGSLGRTRNRLSFSADGSTLAWVRCEGIEPPACTVWRKDLRDPPSPPRPTDVPVDGLLHRVALSDDGRRLAVAETRRVAVYEVSSGNLLAAAEADHPFVVAFLSRDRVRFHEQFEGEGDSGWGVRIHHLDIGSRQLREPARLPMAYSALVSSLEDRLLYLRNTPSGLGLFDGATGEQLVELGERYRHSPSRGHYLADGRLVLALRDGYELTLVVLSPEGRRMQALERGGVSEVRFGGELAPGRVVLALHETEVAATPRPSRWPGLSALFGWTTYVLDAASGEMTALAPGAVPLGYPASTGPRLFLVGGKAVVRWDPVAADDHQVLVPPFDLPRLREGVMPWLSSMP